MRFHHLRTEKTILSSPHPEDTLNGTAGRRVLCRLNTHLKKWSRYSPLQVRGLRASIPQKHPQICIKDTLHMGEFRLLRNHRQITYGRENQLRKQSLHDIKFQAGQTKNRNNSKTK